MAEGSNNERNNEAITDIESGTTQNADNDLDTILYTKPTDTTTCCDKFKWQLSSFGNKVRANSNLCFKLSTGYINSHIFACTGRKLSSEDVTALMLLAIGVAQSIVSSRQWTSLHFKVGVEALISVITLLNDRKNFNVKAKELRKIQIGYIRCAEKCGDLLRTVSVEPKDKSDRYTLSVAQFAQIQEYWEKSNKITISFTHGVNISLYNFKSTYCPYVRMQHLAIALSLLFMLLNVFVFDLSGLFVARSSAALGQIYNGTQGFYADIEVDFTLRDNYISMLGNYTISDICNYTAAFVGTAQVPPNSSTYNLFDILSKISKGLGSIPYRSLASWYTVYKTNQIISMQTSAATIEQALARHFAQAKNNSIEAVKVPHELIQVLNDTGQPERVMSCSQLKAEVSLYNKRVIVDRAWHNAIDKVCIHVNAGLKRSLSNSALPGNSNTECDQLVKSIASELAAQGTPEMQIGTRIRNVYAPNP